MNAIGILITIWNDLRLAIEVAYIYVTKGW